MTLAVFGASGRTGRLVVEAALKAGHQVVAFARSPAKLTQQKDTISLIEVDLSNAQADEVLSKQKQKVDAIISALGPDPKVANGIMERSADLIIAYAQRTGIKRLIWMSGAGVKLAGDKPSFIRSVVRTLMKLVAPVALHDSEAAVHTIIASNLDWTIARAPMLNDEAPSGRLQATDIPPKPAALSRAEIADFLISCAVSTEFNKKTPFLSLGI